MPSRLRQEILQTKPFVNRAEEAFLNIQRSAHVLEQRLHHFLKGYGLTPTQYNAMRILRGSNPDTLPCKDVGGRMITPMPDVTRLLDRLEARGLVTRSRSTEDRRVVEAAITEPGLALLAEIDEPLTRWMEGALGDLGDTEMEILSDLLERARSGSGSGSS